VTWITNRLFSWNYYALNKTLDAEDAASRAWLGSKQKVHDDESDGSRWNDPPEINVMTPTPGEMS
jgi:hypothetical protein